MTPGRRATVTRVAGDVSQKVTGYMFGDLLTSLIAGLVVFVTLLILGVPFPLLWGRGWPWWTSCRCRRGPGRHPHRLVRVHRPGPYRGHRHRGRLRRLHPDREPRPEPGGHDKTARISPLLVFIAVLTGASIGSLIGGIFGGFVAALLAIPTAGALQVLVKEVWQATAPDQPQESPAPAAEPADKYGKPGAAEHRPHPTVQASSR